MTTSENCPTCGMPPGQCYSLCPESPDYYSPEREREDSLFSESLTDGQHWSAAHAEWHANAGVPMGTPGCPWDTCDGPDEYDYDDYDDGPEATPEQLAVIRAAIETSGHGGPARQEDPDDIPF